MAFISRTFEFFLFDINGFCIAFFDSELIVFLPRRFRICSPKIRWILLSLFPYCSSPHWYPPYAIQSSLYNQWRPDLDAYHHPDLAQMQWQVGKLSEQAKHQTPKFLHQH